MARRGDVQETTDARRVCVARDEIDLHAEARSGGGLRRAGWGCPAWAGEEDGIAVKNPLRKQRATPGAERLSHDAFTCRASGGRIL